MKEETKRIFDVLFTILVMTGGVIGFWKAIHEWRESQRWKRSEQLEKIVASFDSSPLLRLACAIVDWTRRDVKHEESLVSITNEAVLMALRNHREEDESVGFPGQQSLFRDALDALLTFFALLEVAIQTRLVDEAPARVHFEYWLRQFATMREHPVANESEQLRAGLGGRSEDTMAAVYIKAYGNFDLIKNICARFQIPLAEPKPLRPARAAGDTPPSSQ